MAKAEYRSAIRSRQLINAALADLLQLGIDLLCGLIGHIGNHHPGGGKGGKVLVHGIDTLAGLSILRQVFGHVIFHVDPAHGDETDHDSKHI